MSNPWIAEHDAWYRRATPAERADFDASRACPARKVFAPKLFPTRRAWAAFLTFEEALDEVIAGTPLPERHVVTGQVRVFDALRFRDRAIAGEAHCRQTGCRTASAGVERRRVTYTNGIVTEHHLCPSCARLLVADPMFDVASVEAAPID